MTTLGLYTVVVTVEYAGDVYTDLIVFVVCEQVEPVVHLVVVLVVGVAVLLLP